MAPGRSGLDWRLHSQRLGLNFGYHLGDGKDRELLFSQFLHLQNASNNSLYPVEAVRPKQGNARNVLGTMLGLELRAP